MTPVSLRLNNFLGILSGLNRDELYLNFEEIVGDAQLVAVIGPNGTGKTTVIDNMHPYRIMPSKVKNYSPSSFSYYDETTGNAEKEFIFTDNGTLYRSSIIIKGVNKTKKTEAYLFFQDETGSWEPCSANNGTVSDGKTATYDACVNDLIGTPEMFFSSQFAAQGRKTISSYDNGDIKSLMSELLNLGHVTELGKNAGDVRKGLQTKLMLMQSDLARVAENESKKEELTKTVRLTGDEADRAKEARPAAREKVQVATRRLTELQAVNNVNTETEIRRNELDSRKTFVTSQLQKKLRETDTDINKLEASVKTGKEQNTKNIEGLNRQVSSHEQQIIKQNELISKLPEVKAAQQKLPGLIEEQISLSDKRNMLQKDAEKIQLLTKERSDLAVDAQKLASQGNSEAAQLKDYQIRAKLCDEVPCNGSDMQSSCKLLSNALEAKGQCETINQSLSNARNQYTGIAGKIKVLTSEISGLNNPQSEIQETQAKIDALQPDIDALNKLIALSCAIENASKIIKSNQESIAEAKASMAAYEDQNLKLDEDANKNRTDLNQRKIDAKSVRDTEMANIETELKRLPPPVEDNGVEKAESELSSADSALANLDLFIEKQNNAIASAKAELEQVDKALIGALQMKSLGTKLEDEIAYWAQLQMALSNDGIIALSIDDAGPTLAKYTNDLLSSCYGFRFSVRIDTQKTAANGNKKETFIITVFDSECGTEKNINSMSGGEKLWINEAITRAIALYQAGLSNKKLKTLFSDESDGALDTEKKIMFVNMKKKVLEIGDYDIEYFISHTPELWQMADMVIDISDYKH